MNTTSIGKLERVALRAGTGVDKIQRRQLGAHGGRPSKSAPHQPTDKPKTTTAHKDVPLRILPERSQRLIDKSALDEFAQIDIFPALQIGHAVPGVANAV